MPITYSWGIPAAAIGPVAAGAGAQQAAMADRDFYAKLGSLFANSFQSGQQQAQQERISAANRAQQKQQFEQSQQRMLDMQRMQFQNQAAAAEREQQYRTQNLELTDRLRTRAQQAEAEDRWRLSQGLPPIREMNQEDARQMETLQRELSNINRQLASGEIDQPLADQHMSRINAALQPLQAMRDRAELMAPVRNQQRTQAQFDAQTAYVDDPFYPGGRRPVYVNPRTGSIEELVSQQRSGSGSGSGSDSTFGNIPQAAIRSELTARARAYADANAANPTAAPFDVDSPENIQRATEAVMQRQLLARRNWGTSQVSQLIGREAERVGTGSDSGPPATPVATRLRRLEQIANLTVGFTDPQSVASYMPEIRQLISRLPTQTAARINDAINRVQVRGTPPTSEMPANGSRTVRTNRGEINAAVGAAAGSAGAGAVLRQMAEQSAQQATGQAPRANPTDLWLPDLPAQDQGEELQRMADAPDEAAKTAEYQEDRQAIDRFVAQLRRQLADLPMLTPSARRSRMESVRRMAERLQEVAPLNAPDILNNLGLLEPATLP